MEEKYKILILTSIILFSFSFIYDLPSTLNSSLEDENDATRPRRLAMLYSVYALPNIVIPMAFGWTSVMESNRLTTLLCGLVFIGHFIYSVGVYLKHFKTMLLGRFIVGVGGESCSVLTNRIISAEFKDSNIAFAMGLFSSLVRLGSIANFATSPFLAKSYHRIVPCCLGLVLVILSICCCHLLNSIITKCCYNVLENDNITDVIETKPLTTNQTSSIVKSHYIEHQDKKVNFSNIFYEVDFNQSPYTLWESVGKDETDIVMNEMIVNSPNILFKEESTIFYEPSVKSTKSWHSSFTILLMVSFSIALVWAPFYSLSTILFKSRYGLEAIESGRVLAIIELIGLIFTPIVGTMGDRFGKKLIFVFCGCSFLVLAHASIYFRLNSAYFVSATLGISVPLVSSYWPCIPSLVSESSLTSCFASVYCVLNSAFTISPIIIGYLASSDITLDNAVLYMTLASIMSLLLTTLLLYQNSKHNLGLNDCRKMTRGMV